MTDRLEDMLKRSRELVAKMTPEELESMKKAQTESLARAGRPCEHGNDWMDCPECWQEWKERQDE